jgi:acylphosphatase
VMIIAEVELNKFDIFLGICKKGPEHAKVESVEVSDYKGEFKEFEIRY